MDAIKFVIGLVAILTFLMAIKGKVDEALVVMRAPEQLSFYFLFFWATTAALVGGLLWAGCQYLLPTASPSGGFEPTLGGSKEPHGLAALLWPLVTNLPTAVLILALSSTYHLLSLRIGTIVSAILLVGLMIASLMFYDIPVSGLRGVRLYIEAKQLGYVTTEMLLVVVWSALLALIPFSAMHVANRMGWISGPGASLAATGLAIGVTVVLTAFVVGFFVAGYPIQKYEAARGVLAGLALRVSLFFGLILSSKT